MNPKSYEFRDIFIKSCDYTNGEGNCTKTREAEKCINGKCEKVSSPAESKKEVMTDYYNQVKYNQDQDDLDLSPYESKSEYNNIVDSYKQSGGNSGVLELNVSNFDKLVLESKIPVLVDFYASWCMHCQHLAPIWDELCNQVDSDKIIIAKYEATEALPEGITIDGFPTIILFKNGKRIPYEDSRGLDDFKKFINENTSQSGGNGKSVILTKTITRQHGGSDKLQDALDNLDKLMSELSIKQKGGCNCGQSGGYNGDPKLKKRLIENLVNKYKGTCKHCGKTKKPVFIPHRQLFRYQCDGKNKNCQRGGCPLCLAAVMLGGAKKSLTKKNSKAKLRLIKIVKSTRPEKKLMAIFEKDGRKKVTHFGSAGMSDYTQNRDPERKKRYLARHKKNENWNDPTSAGSLSKFCLWNKTSLRASIADYKRRFHFN